MAGRNNVPARYIEAYLKVPRFIHDAVCDHIVTNYTRGVVIENDDAELVGVRFYIPEWEGYGFRDELARYISGIGGRFLFHPDSIKTEIIENIQWEETYRRSVRPVVIGRVVVRPPWAEAPAGDLIDIIIEPRMAFGTGTHETTRLCIMEILGYFKPGQSFFDFGCGSGILSILAARLGGIRIKGVDIDDTAVDNARENIVINKTPSVIIEKGSIERAKGDDPYDFVAANLSNETILENYAEIERITVQGGVIVLSGLIAEEKSPVLELIRSHGRLDHKINREGEWLAITITR